MPSQTVYPTCLVILVIATLSILVMLSGDSVGAILMFEREAILHGEVWRLLGCHFVHSGWAHLAVNLAAFMIIWSFVHRWFTLKLLMAVLVASIVLIDVLLLLCNPEVLWYMGLSGILHGIWAAGAYTGMRSGNLEAAVYFIILMAKLLWQQTDVSSALIVQWIGTPVLVDTHVYGTLAGLLSAEVFRIRKAHGAS